MMGIYSLYDLYVEELDRCHDAESRIEVLLPDLTDSITDPGLRQTFSDYLSDIEERLSRLNTIFHDLGVLPSGNRYACVDGLLTECRELMAMEATPEVRNVMLIAAIQRIEHVLIASYGTACAYAKEIGLTVAAELLQEMVEQTATMDRRLSQLAEGELFTHGLNEAALR